MKLGSLISINFYYGQGQGARGEVRVGPLPGSGADGGGKSGPAKDPEKQDRASNTSLYRDVTGKPLSREEIAKLLDLKKRDKEVRRHEAAHMAAGGTYVKGAPTYSYQIGPDGRRYAVGGEVSIDTSKESDPARTLQKMRTVQRAALAPANPSPQDRLVAAKAAMIATQAQMELMQEQSVKQEIQAASTADGGESSYPIKAIDIYV